MRYQYCKNNVEDGKFGKRLQIPTNIGVWRLSLNSPIVSRLKKVHKKIGRISNVTLTIAKNGQDKDTRYSLVGLVLPSQRKHEVPPKNQRMLNLEPLTDEQKQELNEILTEESQE